MVLSGSDVNLFLRCEFEWECRVLRRRIPRRPDAALEAGTFWHTLLAAFGRCASRTDAMNGALVAMAKQRDMIAAFGDDKLTHEFVDQCERLLTAFEAYTDPTLSYEVLAIETALSAALPRSFCEIYEHELIGTPDRIVRDPSGRVWSIQYKTVSDRTPPAVYIESTERSLHELMYAFLIKERFALKDHEYGGTILNVVRKLSRRALRERPESAFIQEPIPIDPIQIRLALRDLGHIGDRMERIKRGLVPAIHNRQSDTNRYGSALSPYWSVRRGRASLDDPTLFMDGPERYVQPIYHVSI